MVFAVDWLRLFKYWIEYCLPRINVALDSEAKRFTSDSTGVSPFFIIQHCKGLKYRNKSSFIAWIGVLALLILLCRNSIKTKENPDEQNYPFTSEMES